MQNKLGSFLRTTTQRGYQLNDRRRLVLASLITLCVPLFALNIFRSRANLQRAAAIAIISPIVLVLDIWRLAHRIINRAHLVASRVSVSTSGIEDTGFPPNSAFQRVLNKLEATGLRSTASKAHDDFIAWIKDELAEIPGIEIEEDPYEIFRWQTRAGMALGEAGKLTLGSREISIAGVVPFSLPTSCPTVGPLYSLPIEQPFDAAVRGKIVLRRLPTNSIPSALGFIPSYFRTSDLNVDLLSRYERPSFWEHPMHHDLIAAGEHGADGIIFFTDLPREQLASYWDPHQGTHYRTPALIVGHEEAEILQRNLEAKVAIEVFAEANPAVTKNVIATLPGQVSERIIYASHTDGNTLVQENGVAALLTLAKYFSFLPKSGRRRTLQFAFNTAHLHVSKEGSGRHAEELDVGYEKDDVALVIPLEHMGTREIEAFPHSSGSGRELRFTGRGELMLWCVGPSPLVVAAVEDAVVRRKLDRVLITRGTSIPKRGRVPLFDSLGGLGTLYHNCLVPTTSLISGPWSLFAPSFGQDAIDVTRLRNQTLAAGDVYLALEKASKEQIGAGYLAYRRRRAEGAHAPGFLYPPERH